MADSTTIHISKNKKYLSTILCKINACNPCNSCLFQINSPEFMSSITFYEVLLLISTLLETNTSTSTYFDTNTVEIYCNGRTNSTTFEIDVNIALLLNCCACKNLILSWMIYNNYNNNDKGRINNLLGIIDNSTTISGLLQSIYLVIKYYHIWM